MGCFWFLVLLAGMAIEEGLCYLDPFVECKVAESGDGPVIHHGQGVQ